ncbi:MAG: ribosomal protein S18-alanine N-acetyltransferase, partial [Moraxellaceae bacterium]|nr:ribosomal protein S18-alanine N-acetyltransferase [Moraxellaceae bacterium]
CAIEQQVQYAPWTEKLFSDSLERHVCWVAQKDQQVVGFFVVQFIVDEAHLLNIAVDPTQQKQGIGRLLLDNVQQQAMIKKASTIFLNYAPLTSAPLALYQMAGFNEIGLRKNYYPAAQGKEDAVIMALMLF